MSVVQGLSAVVQVCAGNMYGYNIHIYILLNIKYISLYTYRVFSGRKAASLPKWKRGFRS